MPKIVRLKGETFGGMPYHVQDYIINPNGRAVKYPLIGIVKVKNGNVVYETNVRWTWDGIANKRNKDFNISIRQTT